MPADHATMTPALNPGDKVGYFEVQQPLAAGGMSLVWQGYDKLLDRSVAIKQIAGHLAADEAIRETFRQEAAIQKKVSTGHKNLVEIIDFIDDERGLFIVMEYVDGSSLEQMLAKLEGPVEPKQALGMIQQIALGLAAIHKAGVVHRDLKPSNILLPREGGVKICDFGLAVIQQEQGGLTMGTARYMAPELFTEQSAEPAADIYSLGVIAYEMAIGRPAFEDAFKTILRDQRNQAVRWMKWHTNRRLAATAAHEVNPDVPEPLSELIERMMEKDPQQRIGSATQLLDVLKRNFSPAGRAAAKQQQKAPASAPGFEAVGEPTAPLPQRSKLPLILVGLLGFNLLVFGGIGVWYLMEQGAAEQARTEAAQEAYAEAKTLFDRGEYAAARDAFIAMANQYDQQGDRTTAARARAALAEAHLHAAEARAAIEAREFQAAEDAFEAAIEKAEQADEPGLIDRDLIGGLREDWNRELAFAAQAADISAAIDSGEFGRAISLIRAFREAGASPSEQQMLNELNQQVEGRSRDAEIRKILQEVRRLEEQDRLREAAARLSQGLQRYEGHVDLREEDDRLAEKIEYQETLESARAAENAGDLSRAISLWQQVDQLRPSDEVKQRIARLRSERAYQDAVRAEQTGNIEAAEEAALKSITYRDNEQARQLLERIGRSVEKQELLERAADAYDAGDYDQAISLYQQVLEDFGADRTVQQQLDQARVRLNVEKARVAIEDWDLQTTERLLDEALSLDSTDPEANRLEADLKIRKQSEQAEQRGDEMRSRGRYGAAKEAYREAREILRKEADMDIQAIQEKTEAIQEKLNETEYEHLLVNTRTAMASQNWSAALGYVKSALNMRDTQEARDLRDQIERRLAEMED